MNVYYFAYGSNMNSARMKARGLVFSAGEAAVLPGYRLAFNKQSHSRPTVAYANIVPASQRWVEGVVYQLDSEQELLKMDVFEGTPVRYSRERMLLQVGESVQGAWVYAANPAFINNQLLPESNYLAHLLAAKNHLSADYLHWLQTHPCIPSACAGGDDGLIFNV